MNKRVRCTFEEAQRAWMQIKGEPDFAKLALRHITRPQDVVTLCAKHGQKLPEVLKQWGINNGFAKILTSCTDMLREHGAEIELAEAGELGLHTKTQRLLHELLGERGRGIAANICCELERALKITDRTDMRIAIIEAIKTAGNVPAMLTAAGFTMSAKMRTHLDSFPEDTSWLMKWAEAMVALSNERPVPQPDEGTVDQRGDPPDGKGIGDNGVSDSSLPSPTWEELQASPSFAKLGLGNPDDLIALVEKHGHDLSSVMRGQVFVASRTIIKVQRFLAARGVPIKRKGKLIQSPADGQTETGEAAPEVAPASGSSNGAHSFTEGMAPEDHGTIAPEPEIPLGPGGEPVLTDDQQAEAQAMLAQVCDADSNLKPIPVVGMVSPSPVHTAVAASDASPTQVSEPATASAPRTNPPPPNRYPGRVIPSLEERAVVGRFAQAASAALRYNRGTCLNIIARGQHSPDPTVRAVRLFLKEILGES